MSTNLARYARPVGFSRGMTMIELLVAMVIGLGVTLAVASLLVAGENHKRTTTSTNDAEQTGAYASYALDRALRSAGSALTQSSDLGVFACRLNVYNGSQLLPRNSFPAPFAANFLPGAAANLRVAPVLIGYHMSDNNTSDVLVVMGGSGAAGGVPRANNAAGTPPSLILQNTVGFSPGDLLLVSNSTLTAPQDCLLEEVQTPTNSTTVTLGTAAPYYYTANGVATNLSTLAGDVTSTYITPLGNANANNVQFQMFGVDANYTLYSYDLLQNQLKVQGIGADASLPIADGVVRMNAIYGVVNGGVQGWADPFQTAGYDIATVMTTSATMKSIIAVRVALLVRGEYYDKKGVSPASFTFFNGLKDFNGKVLTQIVNVPDQHYRYRVFEFTVPLRNMLILDTI
ncbi:MAG: PilW family protein [Pseudomonadota bacterium]|nr:PilW family protein [Pseudomonadota bacterium]